MSVRGDLLAVAGPELDGVDDEPAAVVGVGGGLVEEVALDFDGFAAGVASEAFGGGEGQFTLVRVLVVGIADDPGGGGVGVGAGAGGGGESLEAAEEHVVAGGMPAEGGFGVVLAGVAGGQGEKQKARSKKQGGGCDA